MKIRIWCFRLPDPESIDPEKAVRDGIHIAAEQVCELDVQNRLEAAFATDRIGKMLQSQNTGVIGVISEILDDDENQIPPILPEQDTGYLN